MRVFIECEWRSRIKLEAKHDHGVLPGENCSLPCLALDRIIDIPFPAYYGYVVGSEVQPDGDLQDAFVVSELPLKPGDIVRTNPQLHVAFEDNGVRDDKVICAYNRERAFDALYDIIHFLTNYKKNCRVIGYTYYRENESIVLPTGEEFYEPKVTPIEVLE